MNNKSLKLRQKVGIGMFIIFVIALVVLLFNIDTHLGMAISIALPFFATMLYLIRD